MEIAAVAQTQAKAAKAKPKNADNKKSSLVEMKPWPSYIQDRIILWDKLKAEYDSALAAKEKLPIKVTLLPDGNVVEATSWKDSPYDVACGISTKSYEYIIAKVDEVLWDLDRPLEKDCSLQLLKFDDDEAKQVYWHSTAHVLGEAMERCYGGCLCYGPPNEDGFYYDMYLKDQQAVSNFDFPVIENVMKSAIKDKQPFERLEMKKQDLLEMFKYNEFKVRILNEKIDTPTTTAYRCGPLIELCLGPHVRHTGKIKSFAITKNSSSYWEGRSDAESLQRVYGISFPYDNQLKVWKKLQEDAKNNDHRKLGREQELFFFNELSPGSCFFLPHGAHIYNTLVEFIRGEYRNRGFEEVISPNVYKVELWKTSGHWQHYEENMYSFEVEKEIFAMKPMNCPGHCLIFGMCGRSWQELPFRMADFGVLHRKELTGALSGLTRVRRFQQDDGHIFCTRAQIKSEINDTLLFLRDVYKVFGFTFQLKLSTRPESSEGEDADWEFAEKQLSESLDEFGVKWTWNRGDGAFYGPKIDVTISALGSSHQCGTIQLDLQLPKKFKLNFINELGKKDPPVIIHRAILGSVERMIAIITESCKGKWPFWLSPRQCKVVPVSPASNDYANKVTKQISAAGFRVTADLGSRDLMNKKIWNARLSQHNFILIVGKKEELDNTVNVRRRGKKETLGEYSVERVVQLFTQLSYERGSVCKDNESEKVDKSLQLGVDELVNEQMNTEEMKSRVAPVDAKFTQKQLTDDKQSQLNTLQSEVKELKEAKMSLEKQLEAANVLIQKLGVDRAF